MYAFALGCLMHMGLNHLLHAIFLVIISLPSILEWFAHQGLNFLVLKTNIT
jgi:hypothetical protein